MKSNYILKSTNIYTTIIIELDIEENIDPCNGLPGETLS